MNERLLALLEALRRISDNYGIASQWQSDYSAALVELQGIIADAGQIMAPPAAVEQRLLSAEDLAALSSGIVTAVAEEIHASDVAVLAAVAETRADLLAAAPAK